MWWNRDSKIKWLPSEKKVGREGAGREGGLGQVPPETITKWNNYNYTLGIILQLTPGKQETQPVPLTYTDIFSINMCSTENVFSLP